MTKDIHPFGLTFKKMRESRGFSLKEAARDIVSPQFLSQFEKGKKGMSIENFSRLLISIGLDWSNFVDFYEGDRIDAWALTWSKLVDSGIHYEQYIPEAMKSLKDYYQDNHEMKEYVMTFMKVFQRYQSGNFEGMEKEIEKIKVHLTKINCLNLLEEDLTNALIEKFPLKLVEKLEKTFLDNFKKSSDYNALTNAHNSLLFIIGYYSTRGYYLRADQLINKIKELRSIDAFRMSYDMAMLEREEVFHLLRQNKAEAIPKARNVINFFRLMKEFAPGNEYYIEVLPSFITKVNQANHTGIELFPIDMDE